MSDVEGMAEVDRLAQAIRRIDGNHDMGAGALAESLIDAGYVSPADVARIKAEAWDEGRESVAMDFLKPLKRDGTRIGTPNPYRAAAVTGGEQ